MVAIDKGDLVMIIKADPKKFGRNVEDAVFEDLGKPSPQKGQA